MRWAGRLRVALFGTPGFALPTLEALHSAHELLLVVTQSPKPAGRGLALRRPAVELRARELGIPVEQPSRLKGNEEFRRRLGELELDVAVTAAYGRILPQSLLEVPRHGFLNVHASLLPRYRGAAPVQRALIAGETRTGVSIMQTDVGLDTGPVRLQRATGIGDGERAGALLVRLADLGASALLDALAQLAVGELGQTVQDEAQATFAPPLTVEDGRVRWDDSLTEILARDRGVDVWPGSYFSHAEGRVKVIELREPSRLVDDGAPGHRGTPGEVLSLTGETILVATGDEPVELVRLKPAGGREMSARAWANGRGVKRGTRLG